MTVIERAAAWFREPLWHEGCWRCLWRRIAGWTPWGVRFVRQILRHEGPHTEMMAVASYNPHRPAEERLRLSVYQFHEWTERDTTWAMGKLIAEKLALVDGTRWVQVKNFEALLADVDQLTRSCSEYRQRIEELERTP